MSASWIENTEKESEKVKEQEWENITIHELKTALSKSQKWKSPGIDKVPNILLSSHVTFTSLLNELMQDPEKTPEWLSTTHKLLISVLTDRTYFHLEQNDLFPIEQKGCRCGSYGSKKHLMIKMIHENCKKRKRNLSCAWIDYKHLIVSLMKGS